MATHNFLVNYSYHRPNGSLYDSIQTDDFWSHKYNIIQISYIDAFDEKVKMHAGPCLPTSHAEFDYDQDAVKKIRRTVEEFHAWLIAEGLLYWHESENDSQKGIKICYGVYEMGYFMSAEIMDKTFLFEKYLNQ